MKHDFASSYDACYSFGNNFIFFFLKLLHALLRVQQRFTIHKDSQYLPLYTSYIYIYIYLPLYKYYFLSLNDDIVGIEIPVQIRSLTLITDDFSVLLLHPSVFSIKYSRSALIYNNHIIGIDKTLIS